MIYRMGVWDGEEKIKENVHKKLKIGLRGIQGIPGTVGLRGPAGKDAVLPKNLLKTTGFTMAGQIDMNLHQIKRVAYPSLLDDAACNSYVDNNKTVIPNDVLKLDGSNAMTDDLDINDKRILYVGEAISNSDAINMGKVNTLIGNATSSLINRNGDTFFGDIDMRPNRILNLKLSIDQNEPATKKYTDDGLNEKVSKNGDYMHGDLSMAGDHSIIGLKIQFMIIP